MQNTFSYLAPQLDSLTLSPKMVQLFIPPIRWHGDPKGHIGTYDTFFYVADGECSLKIGEESFVLTAGDLAFLPHGRMRAYSNMSQTITLYEMNFEAYINGEDWFSALGLDDGNFLVRPKNAEEIKQLFEQSVRYEFNKDMLYDVIHTSNLLSIIGIFATEKTENSRHTRPFKEVIAYMKENLGRTVKISELSRLVFMEETYFIKKFRRAFGTSPIVYLNKLRIYKAMTYLAESNMTLSEIGHKVGIYDSSYFSKMFKSHCGITPGEYRNLFT